MKKDLTYKERIPFGELYDFILFFSFVPDAGASNGSEYIALIPLTDQRLRPQRITIKILLTVMLCLIISGLLLFFLMLRSVELSSADHLLLPDNVDITESTVSLNLSVSPLFT